MACSAYLAWVATETWHGTASLARAIYSWETSLFKTIRITERVKMEFRAEAFNVLNHTNFQLPGAGATNNRTNSGSFGQAGGTFNPRNLQFGLKLAF